MVQIAKESIYQSTVEQLGTFKEINWYGHLWVESEQIATVFKGVDKFPTNHVPLTSNSKNWYLRAATADFVLNLNLHVA